MQSESEVKVAQSCPTLCDPTDCTMHGILQARLLEWVAFPFSRGSSQPRDQTQSPTLQADSLPAEPQGKPQRTKARIKPPTLKGFSAVRWLSGTDSNLPPAPGFLDGKESAFNAGDSGLISGLGRSPGEGDGNPLQYSCLENSMDRGAWQATQSMWLQRVRHNSATNKASYLTSLSFRFLILKNRINHTVWM